ncbi:MAG: hypothetical protein RL701_5014 [Pseudomonadota bacterium]
MWDDPNESSALRKLLRAGRVEQVDYDVERGLARHLANLQAGVAPPAWAVQTAAPKLALTSWAAWLVPPVVSVIALGGWLYASQAPTSLPTLSAVAQPAGVGAALANEGRGGGAALNAHSDRALDPSALHPHPQAEDSALHRAPAVSGMLRGAAPTAATRAPAVKRGRAQAVGQVNSAPSKAQTSHSTTTADGASASAVSAVTNAPPARAETVAAQAQPEPAAANVAAKPEAAAAAQAKPSQPTAAEPQQPEGRAAVEPDTRLEREMQMLAVAQRVLADDPARALRLTKQGESEFPRSMFSAERTQISLLALIQLGHLDEARRLAVPFLRAYPNAPWTPRLREALTTGHLP